MTSDETDENGERRSLELRRLVTLVLGSIEIIAFLLFIHLALTSIDPLGEDIGLAAALTAVLPILVLTLPGLLLAWLGRAPDVAIALVIAAIPVSLVLMT